MRGLPTRLAFALVLMAFACLFAQAQPSTDGPSPLARFIDDDGLGNGQMRRSDLDRLFGRPEVEKPVTPSLPAKDRRTWLHIAYPSRGLLFTTLPGSYGEADPLIDMGHFTLPYQDCTPQGLCMGMPQADAMALIRKHYKISGDFAVSFGNSGNATGRNHFGRNKGWRDTHYVSFSFNEGRLHSMSLQLAPKPLVTMYDLKRAAGTVLGIAILLAIGLSIEAFKKRMEPLKDSPVLEAGKLGLGVVLLVVGIGGAILAFGMFSGDGYAKMAALLMGLGAAGMAVFSLFVFSRSNNPIISRVAGGILLLGFVAAMLPKLF